RRGPIDRILTGISTRLQGRPGHHARRAVLFYQDRRRAQPPRGTHPRSPSGQHGAVHNDGTMQRETEWQYDLRDQDIETQKRYKECLRGDQRARNVYRGQRRTGETGGKRHQGPVPCQTLARQDHQGINVGAL
ncbi:hypothetical protein LTR66_014919, partial [Elasticomyces elasticus]